MDKSISGKNVDTVISSTDWPASGLEYIGACPVCIDSQRTLMHQGLVDNVFFCASGKWDLWRCSGCESAYLDPRPTPQSIHLAYENYYTHNIGGSKENYDSLNPIRKLRRQLVNGYTNWRYGTTEFPSSVLGVLAAYMIPNMKKLLDREFRHLPLLPPTGGVILDVGCGDGSFLIKARNVGWKVVGLDPDPVVATNAAKQNLTAHQGGIEYFEGHYCLFDVITLSHVIEHVHEPIKVLKICHDLLRPGGQLWIETPNIDSFGHSRFGKNWRGLETPRHLVLFNINSMNNAISASGFISLINHNIPSPCAFIWQSSINMMMGQSPYEANPSLKVSKLQLLWAELCEYLYPKKSEFMTISAKKTEIS